MLKNEQTWTSRPFYFIPIIIAIIIIIVIIIEIRSMDSHNRTAKTDVSSFATELEMLFYQRKRASTTKTVATKYREKSNSFQ